MIYRLGELFCGPGGLAWGALHADIGTGDRIVHAWANDYDGPTCDTYRRNICPEAPETVYQGDVRTFDMSQLSPIDALAFGNQNGCTLKRRLTLTPLLMEKLDGIWYLMIWSRRISTGDSPFMIASPASVSFISFVSFC